MLLWLPVLVLILGPAVLFSIFLHRKSVLDRMPKIFTSQIINPEYAIDRCQTIVKLSTLLKIIFELMLFHYLPIFKTRLSPFVPANSL